MHHMALISSNPYVGVLIEHSLGNHKIDGLVQDSSNSIANALELLQSM